MSRPSLLHLLVALMSLGTAPLRAQVGMQPDAAGIDRLEEAMWRGASAAGTAAAYETYLNRYLSGAHADAARAALDMLRRSTAEAVAGGSVAPTTDTPAALVSGTPAATTASEQAPFVCRPVYSGEPPFEQAADAELPAYLQALRLNSVTAYQAYLTAFPQGTFAPEVAALIATRQGRLASLEALPGRAQARARVELAPIEADYPSVALRDSREGQATVAFEIAEDGCVEACRVTTSSGAPALDAATCRAVTLRGRFDPARDAAGQPVRSAGGTTFRWLLPQH